MGNFLKILGALKEISDSYVKVNGIWKLVSDKFTKVNGEWKPIGKKYDYEVQYLESTGTQYIDSGIDTVSMDLDFEIKCSVQTLPTSKNTGTGTFFGTRATYNTNVYHLTTYTPNLSYKGHFAYDTHGLYASPLLLGLNTDGICVMKKDGLTFYRPDGNTGTLSSSNFSYNNNLYIFALKEGNTVFELISMRLYSLQFWSHSTGLMIRDFIPVVKDGVGYLYDKVSKQLFGNIGTGAFNVGPITGKKYDKQVEYVESTGSQWIDTGIIYSSGMSVVIDSEVTGLSSSSQVFADFSADTALWFGVRANSWNFYHETTTLLDALSKKEYKIKWNSGTAYVYYDDAQVASRAYTVANAQGRSLKLFACSNNYFSQALIYSVKVYDSTDTLIANFIPVSYKGVGYLYDTIGLKLYGSEGSDNLYAGPAITGVPYDYRVKYLESTGTLYIDTGIKLYAASEATFRIDCKTYLVTGQTENACLINNMYEVSPYPGTVIRYGNSSTNYLYISGDGTNLKVCDLQTIHLFTYSLTNITGNQHNVNTTLFAGYDGNGNPLRYIKARIYHCRIIDHGVIVRDFIPVVKNGVGYMYDIVTNQLFSNQGTGSFLFGAGATLPYDCAVEYILNIASSYINTGYKPNNNTRVLCDLQTITSTKYGRLFGCVGGTTYNSTPNYCIDYEEGVTGKLNILWGNDTAWNTLSSVTGDYNRHTYDFNKTQLYRDNTLLFTHSAVTFQCTTNLAIFNYILSSGVSTSTDERWLGKLYSFKIYENDTLVRDFIPVMVGGVGALYDIVESKIYNNAGSGSFAVGSNSEI